MRKIILGILLVLCFTTSSVSAMRPPSDVVIVHIENYEGIVDIKEVQMDALVKLDNEPHKKQDYIEKDLPYDIASNGYFSITAYETIFVLDDEPYKRDNKISFVHYEPEDPSFILILFNYDGTVYYNQTHDMGEVGDSEDNRYERWFVYDMEQGTMRIESKRVPTFLERVGLAILIVLAFFAVVTMIIGINYLLQRQVLKHFIGVGYKEYSYFIGVYSLVYFLGAFNFPFLIGFNWVRVLLYVIFYSISVLILLRLSANKLKETLSLSQVMLVMSPPLLLALLLWQIALII